MKVIDPGHAYLLQCLDPAFGGQCTELRFVKRIGPNYPGNESANPGPITQEVLRALIARTKYVDKQIHYDENDIAMTYMRLALYYFEVRAKKVRDEELSFSSVEVDGIENLPTCSTCGHIECTKHPKE